MIFSPNIVTWSKASTYEFGKNTIQSLTQAFSFAGLPVLLIMLLFKEYLKYSLVGIFYGERNMQNAIMDTL